MSTRNDKDATTLAPETLMMSHGYNPWWSEGAVKAPLFLTSTFLFKTAEDGEEFFKVALGKKKGEGAQGLIYSRLNSPSLEILEERLALWEKAEKASVFASGWRRSARCSWLFASPATWWPTRFRSTAGPPTS